MLVKNILKVFKYEFLALARVLALIYAIIPALSLIIGIFFRLAADKESSFFDAIFRSSTLEYVFFFLIQLFCITVAVTTLLGLSRRFRVGMFGNEAYLNWTLPVSINEHLCARLLSSVAWLFIYLFAGLLSVILFSLCFIDKIIADWNFSWTFIEDSFGCPALAFFPLAFFSIFTSLLLFVLFVYMINCIGFLAKKKSRLVQVIAVIACIFLVNYIGTQVIPPLMRGFLDTTPFFYIITVSLIIMNIIYSALCYGVCYLVLRFRLNLS